MLVRQRERKKYKGVSNLFTKQKLVVAVRLCTLYAKEIRSTKVFQ
jgi:hypothetical protein